MSPNFWRNTSGVDRWVQASPELDMRCLPILMPVNKGYRIDEIYTTVKGIEKYLLKV